MRMFAKFSSLGMVLLVFVWLLGGYGQVSQSQAPCTVKLELAHVVQQAINDAAEGAVVCLAKGTFFETLEIKKRLTLRGAGRNQTLLEPRESNLPNQSAVLIASNPEIDVVIEDLTISRAQVGITVKGNAKLTLNNAQVSINTNFGLFIDNAAVVNVSNSIISDNANVGVLVGNTARVSFQNTQLSDNEGEGLMVWGDSAASLTDSQVINNGHSGLQLCSPFLGDCSASLDVRGSTIAENGRNLACLGKDLLCNGIELRHQGRLQLTDSIIKDNTDWGILAFIAQCSFKPEEVQLVNFTGQTSFSGQNTVTGNNKSGNQNGKGNPGNHPFKSLPDGQVCLP
ncbi:right-handed parallel beta-helix repeat-containing protein [Candidatus Acetothermia bacterium]|nr:right-handed parallel beta-helix repeat-containing protein [Candidatus Acetothermia bacterium]